MRRLVDVLRGVLLSPELILILGAVALASWLPALVSLIAQQIKSNISTGAVIAASPLPMLAWGWIQVWEMLSPDGTGKVLLQWPHYYMLKCRVFVCLAWCGIGCVIGFGSILMILLEWHASVAVGLLIGGVLAAASATATLAMARVRLRELLSTQNS